MSFTLKAFIFTLAIFTLAHQSLVAKDLGVHGTLFQITEHNLLHVLEQRLKNLEKSGKLAEAQQKITKRVQEKALEPQPVAGVIHTVEARQFLWNPTTVVEEDIKDHQGNVIIAKGTQLNPLDHFRWGQPILLIDGEAEDQLVYANSFKEQKLILVKGKPLTIEQQVKRPVYFDQGGILVQKFGIQQVPCRISQKGKNLLVEEIYLSTEKTKNEREQK